MGRTSEITYEAVATVCSELATLGKRPTFALIKGELGGSYEVLKRHIDRWMQESAVGARYALPDDLATELGVWYQRAKGQAQTEAEHWLDQEKAILLAKERQWQTELDTMKTELTKANEQCAQMGHDLSIKTLQAQHAIEKAAALSQNVTETSALLLAKTNQCADLIEQLAASKTELISERQRHTHELAIAEERTRGAEKAVLMRHHAEVELQKAKCESLSKQLDDVKMRRDMYEQRANALQAENNRLKLDAKG
jgi:cell division septum initiation protein DivIVA